MLPLSLRYAMDNLPAPLVVEILSRLPDSAELARCRLVSKTMNALAGEVRSIRLLCTSSLYKKSCSPYSKATVPPFKAIFNGLVAKSGPLESVSISVDKSLIAIWFSPKYESDDQKELGALHLTDVGFVGEWLPKVRGTLRSLSISDFWLQAAWRRSDVLALISSCCDGLLELEVKNARLSVNDLKPMIQLTSLSLECVNLDDRDLSKVNSCFPCLQVLNLIRVSGLYEPKIHLFHLRTCRWIPGNAPHSVTIKAPSLVKLELQCIRPECLVLETPLLSDFYLSLEKLKKFEVKELQNLKNLKLESGNLSALIGSFPLVTSVKSLTLDSSKYIRPFRWTPLFLDVLFNIFPNVGSLTLDPGAWYEAETGFLIDGLQSTIGMEGLKSIVLQLAEIHHINVTLSFISRILNECPSLSDIALLIHRELDPKVATFLISQCRRHWPGVRWRCGIWERSVADT